MYYDSHNNIITSIIPDTITLSNGTIITGPIADMSILADAGYFTVRSDSPPQPINTTENITQRAINIDGNYADIIRTWIPLPIVVPETISARQVRLWLIDNDIDLSNVEAAIDTISDLKLREKTRVEWEYAPYIERNHPLIESLAQYLGLTSQQIDQGFIDAAQL
jgi:hypothetical protein